MVGLVNSAGTAEGSRVLAGERSNQRAHQERQEQQHGKLLPLIDSVDAADRVLRRAVETLEFSGTGAARHLPEGTESDRFDQAELEATSPQPLGGNLDVLA